MFLVFKKVLCNHLILILHSEARDLRKGLKLIQVDFNNPWQHLQQPPILLISAFLLHDFHSIAGLQRMEPLNIDQETAQKWFHHGATCLLLGLPTDSDFGIDLMEWRIGPKFQGIKFIPPGLHYICFR
jgi:hypothetical protein